METHTLILVDMLLKLQGSDSNKKRCLQNVYNSVLAIILAGTLFLACTHNTQKHSATRLSKAVIDSLIKKPPIMHQENFVVVITDSGRITTKITGPEIQQFADEEEYTEFTKGLKVLRFDINGQQTSSLVADYAKEFAKDKQWEARGNVIATNSEGDSLKTEYLLWDEKKNEISSDQFVEFVNEDNTTRGIGFVSSTDMKVWRILKSGADFTFDR
ncbi:MAG: LPS export ABC transporter periplasmic protein LptC [Bacteroidales bacterium]